MNKRDKKHQDSLEEIKKLAELADNNQGFEFGIIEESELKNKLQDDLLNDIQNPELSHKLWYSIEGISRVYLPKGKQAKKIRAYVREEKNIFLNTGKRLNEKGIRGGDGRMGFTSVLKEALEAVTKWALNGGGTFEYFMIFRELNIKYGHTDEKDKNKYNQKLSGFNKSLKKSIDFNPKDKDNKDD